MFYSIIKVKKCFILLELTCFCFPLHICTIFLKLSFRSKIVIHRIKDHAFSILLIAISVYSCFMAILFRLQEKTYDHAVERFTMRKDPLPNFFRISNVMLCCRKIFRFPRRPHCHIVNQACCQLNVMHKNNDLIIFIVILKAD